jgi:hypothetical protein
MAAGNRGISLIRDFTVQLESLIANLKISTRFVGSRFLASINIIREDNTPVKRLRIEMQASIH